MLKHKLLLVFPFIVGFLLSSCNPQTTLPTALATLPQPTAANTPLLGEPTWTPSPQPLNPTPTVNVAEPNPVQITELAHVQVLRELVVAVKFQNILPDTLLRDVNYEILALDAAGNRVAREAGVIPLLIPQQTSGLVRSFQLQAGVQAELIEVRFSAGTQDRDLNFQSPFEVINPAFFVDLNGALMTGWLRNRDKQTYTEVEVNAIGYNTRGEIVGGGSLLTEFVPQEDRIGVSIPVTVSEAPVRVEIYPWISPYTASLEGGSWWKNIRVEDWDFIITDEGQVAGGAILTNITDQVLTGTYYIITISDAQDRVCAVSRGFIHMLLPEETLNFSPGILYPPTTSTPTHVDLIIVPGEFGEYPLAYNPLSITQSALLLEEQEAPIVRVTVLNNLNASLSGSLVTVVLKNERGRIVGGGQALTGPIRAGSTLQVDVLVAFLANPENLTISASVTLPPGVVIGE
jgi:hypothetical protein